MQATTAVLYRWRERQVALVERAPRNARCWRGDRLSGSRLLLSWVWLCAARPCRVLPGRAGRVVAVRARSSRVASDRDLTLANRSNSLGFGSMATLSSVSATRTERDRHTLVLDLGLRLREVVLPELGSHAGRAEAGEGAGGDVTFAVDEIAEQALVEFVAERAPRIAFYSEDRGLVAAGDATDVLVVDPIDGTRPAMAGLESACVAVALAPLGDGEPTMADVEVGCVVEIKSRRLVPGGPRRGGRRLDAAGRAERRTVDVAPDVLGIRVPGPAGAADGRGAGRADRRLVGRRRDVRARLAGVRDDADRDRPARRRGRGRLADDRRVPGMRAEFERVGGGEVLNNSPYDLAAPWLCLREAGGVVSDGWGEPLDRHRLLGSGHEFQMSSISAANPRLHAAARPRGRRGSRTAARAAADRDGSVSARYRAAAVSHRRPPSHAPARLRRPQAPLRLREHRRTSARRRDPRAGRAARGQADPAPVRDRLRRWRRRRSSTRSCR